MYTLKKAEEHDFSQINNFLKILGSYGSTHFGYYEALDSYNYDLEKVFSPRVVRHILFSKDKNWFIIYLDEKVMGLLLISNPNVLLESTASVLLFAGFEKNFDKNNCEYSYLFSNLPTEITKISIRANECGENILKKNINGEFEVMIPLKNKEYYYAIFKEAGGDA
ncbi:hypothetical protein [Candidatus Enterococcus ikei]|uniref:N-acetyltransferase domain-containing protein n=1 Tax=Candidatus Enterococcus ikei TaxID=2815326 RepID=A0ABS3H1M3_9ENTE|nr:hypothetical protein [Enterococcus sp. DIV0869a]MBO0441433.1 hypothetical protein [Enterococcus sp. DIV0869a]